MSEAAQEETVVAAAQGEGPAAAGHAGDEAETGWRRNLTTICGAIIVVSVVNGLATPFLPLYLRTDLGIHDHRALALWTGMVAGVVPFTVVVASPVWGWIADRFGRKATLVRAVGWVGFAYVLAGFVQTPLQLVGVRVMHGLASGIQTASTSLVAAGTPREQVPRALGRLSSARGLGQAVGPALGGLAATFVPLRAVFVGMGLIQMLSSVGIALWVREIRQPQSASGPASIRHLFIGGMPAKRNAIVVVMAGIGLAQFSLGCAQQMIVLRMIEIVPAQAAIATGAAFTGLSLATVAAGAGYIRLLPPLGFRGLALAAGLLAAAAAALAAGFGLPAVIVAAAVLFGLGQGSLNPILSSMLGLEAPSRLKSSLFGISGSVLVAGSALGPLTGGVVAAVAGTPAGLLVAGAAAVTAGTLIVTLGREPVAD